MLRKEVLQEAIRSQREGWKLSETGIPRNEATAINIDISLANVISGIRRCGKSTLLAQLMKKAKNPAYFNFEDTRIAGFETNDFSKLEEVLQEEYGRVSHYFFDEVQNVPQWERFIRHLLDEKKKCTLTGSNASLLSRELGTHLTGRHLTTELFPFSFTEFCLFYQKKANEKIFDEYLEKGGFPEYLKLNQPQLLQTLVNDIIARDIIVRYRLRSPQTIREITTYLLSNIGKEFSHNAIAKLFNLGSVNSAVSYVSFLEESYLIFAIPKFDYAIKKQMVNPKKIYAIDNGLIRENSISFSADKGRMLENAVFLHLRRGHKQLYYYKGKRECDFIIREKEKIVRAIQVCYEIDSENQTREIEGLTEAMDTFKLNEGYVITHHQEDELKQGNHTIHIIPAWKWTIANTS